MDEKIVMNCKSMIENRDRIKSVFGWENGLIHLACAGIYFLKDQEVNIDCLQNCRKMLKQKTGSFSNFRYYTEAIVSSILATSNEPERCLDNSLLVYQMLKKEFKGSTYLALTALIIEQNVDPRDYEEVVFRTKRIYNKMKMEHPFLITGEDCAKCALMALSEKSDETLILETEDCYQRLKSKFFSANAVQELSQILAIGKESANVKCQRTMDLFDSLKLEGHKYGTSYELPSLGILALNNGLSYQMIKDIIAIDNWLANQKGFGFFSVISAKQRLMYAGILSLREHQNFDLAGTLAISSSIAIIMMQDTALAASIAASVAISSAAT